jgi:hypothetical protein
MRRPPQRSPRNDQRLLNPQDARQRGQSLRGQVTYQGHPDHKSNPVAFGLPAGTRPRSGALLCDRDGGFGANDVPRVPQIIDRALEAGLISDRRIWVVDDNGQIYELTVTNATQNVFHGYPVHPEDGIVMQVVRRFSEWAAAQTNAARYTSTLNGLRTRYGI